MASITPNQDGSATVTVSAGETAGLKAVAAQHLPLLDRLSRWFGNDIAPELTAAADFLKVLTGAPDSGSALTLTATQVGYLRGLLSAHVPDFQQVLAVVESPVVRSLLTLATDLVLCAAGKTRRRRGTSSPGPWPPSPRRG